MKKTFFVLLSALFISYSAFAQVEPNEQLNPLITGVPSLTITPDSRGGGMGDVGAATTPDINSQHWNPAKYAFMESPAGFSFSYTPWLSKLVSDINLLYAAGYWKFDEGAGNVIKDWTGNGNDAVAEKDLEWPEGIEVPQLNKE